MELMITQEDIDAFEEYNEMKPNGWFKLYNGKTLLMLNETELDLINEALNIMIPVKGINNTDIIDDIVELKVSIKAQREKMGTNYIYGKE